MKKLFEKEKGITLITLVITIIVILIIAGVSISVLSGENGVITKANKAVEEQAHAEVKEAIILAYNAYKIEHLTSKEIKSETDVATVNRKIKLAAIIVGGSGLKKVVTFKKYMIEKEYMTEDNNHIVVEKLLGRTTKFGNGTNKKDEYLFEEKTVQSTEVINGKNVEVKEVTKEINYYDKNSKPTTIWVDPVVDRIINTQSDAESGIL